MKASVQKASMIRPDTSTEHRFMTDTDRQTRTDRHGNIAGIPR